MYHQDLSDEEILNGFRNGDAHIIRKYFYGYCKLGYNIFNQRYQLSLKENLDFMSLAHQYAIYLMEHNWKPLEDHSPEVSLKTWFINGFRYVVLDALKWYRKEYGSITFEDYLQSFDVSSNLRLQFNQMVKDACDRVDLIGTDRQIIDLLLIKGFKGKEVADQMGLTPSAISQRYKGLKERIIAPYFRMYSNIYLETPEVMVIEPKKEICHEPSLFSSSIVEGHSRIDTNKIPDDVLKLLSLKRYTPEPISELQPGEIFVFGSNLKGIHCTGAAYTAYSKFGAIMGQGVGLQGQSYAIPTMQGGVETIRPYVDNFINYAKRRPKLTFLVSRIGCDIAGFKDIEICPLFEKATRYKNIILPKGW